MTFTPPILLQQIENKFITLVIMIGVCLPFSSCNKDANVDSTEQMEVNEWILNKMNTYYYWSASLTAKTYDLKSPSDAFFESLLYKRGQIDGDRFSWYQSSYRDLLDNIYTKSAIDPGFAYTVITKDNQTYIQVEYAKPNSNALRAGLKRGKLISHINGTRVSTLNYLTLLKNLSLHLEFIKLELEASTYHVVSDGTLYFEGNVNFFEEPILTDSLYTLEGSGTNSKKIAYIVYNRFISDRENGSNEFDIELNQRLASLKARGAEYYIIDLRYNRGGYMSCAIHLASALIPSEYKDSYLGSMQFNPSYQEFINQSYGPNGLRDYFVAVIADSMGNKKPIVRIEPEADKLYFLVSPSTASASEILIWGLDAFRSNRMVGTQTRGKFMGSYSLYEMNDPVITCGIQPLVCQYYNSKGHSGPTSGLAPHTALADSELHPYELGNTNEPLLHAALKSIEPSWETSPAYIRKIRIPLPSVQIVYESVEHSLPEGAILSKH